MNSDLFPTYDKHLPGRDPSEDKALLKFARAVVSAERKLKTLQAGTRATPAGRASQRERVREQRLRLDDANEALVAQLKRLAEHRATLLPRDAETITNPPRATEDHSWDRYKVYAHGPSGQTHLGGCMTLGEGEARARWFKKLLNNRD